MSTLNTFASDSERWDAVRARDAAADGTFVYGVRTTGVYCRPGCPARRPRRENVAFFETPIEAEAAGLRACRRCRPHEAEDPQRQTVVRICRALERAETTPGLADLAAEFGWSPAHLQRTFRRVIGLSPREYAAACRSERFRAALAETSSITAALYEAGYSSSSRCYEHAERELGMTPGQVRRKAPGSSVRIVAARCTLGWVGVALTPRGICGIVLGDAPDAVAAELRERTAQAELVTADEREQHTVARVVALIDDPCGQPAADLPLDIRGTAFQRQVWDALRRIRPGATLTYGELAEQIGRPSAVRAVAGACAANEVAVVIPCHRAVRRDGGLGGYRWGIERKRVLLRKEGALGE